MPHTLPKTLCIALLAVLVSGFFHLKPRKAYLTNYGLCQFSFTETVENPNAITGQSAIVDGIQWLKKTTKVPAQKGVSFGIEYRVNHHSDEPIKLQEVILFPSAGLTHPDTGKNQKQESFEVELIPGEPSFTCYTFDYPWEIVKGTWTFQVSSDGRRLLEKSFTIE